LLAAQSNRIVELAGLGRKVTVGELRAAPNLNSLPWWKWALDYDPSTNIRRTRCPVLALNGERDCQVIYSQNLPAIRSLLPESQKNMIKQYPELNHLFQHCTTGLPTEYGQIEETISQEVLQDIAQWIRNSIAL
ncbi:MAG: alpha/beta hydrolase, partial [Bacteroidaceae bacterium]|nr:alpha/beta hydrolase [Bacteroidaceae bacterium]